MLELSVKEAYDRAGVDCTDSEWERDLKFSAWVHRENWRCVRSASELEQARADGVEIIIKKGNF